MPARSSALGGVEIKGLDDIRRSLDPHIFNYAGKIVLRRALYKTRTGARDIVPGKRFDDSINVRTLPDGINGIVYSNAKSALSVHEGRQPGEKVSIRKLRAYIQRYHLSGAVSLKTRRSVKVRRTVSATDGAEIALAIRMQRGIEQQGTKPIEYLTRPLDATSRDLVRYWREAVPKAIEHFARRRG